MTGRVQLTVSGGFALVMAGLLLADTGGILPWALLACALHEAGHAGAIHLLGGRVSRLELTAWGAAMTPFRRRLFSYGEEVMIALAGPAASLTLAVLTSLWARQWGRETAHLLAGLHFMIGVFNLLPAYPMDGGRILEAILCPLLGPAGSERLCALLSRGIGMVLAPLGMLAAVQSGGNLTLLAAALWLMAGQRILEAPQGHKR